MTTQFKLPVNVVTGGLGYLGSNLVLELLKKKEHVLILDDLSNSEFENLSLFSRELEQPVLDLSGGTSLLTFNVLDLKNYRCLHDSIEKLTKRWNVKCVYHFAGFKDVSESIQDPSKYYMNNVLGTLNLLSVMDTFNLRNLVFSSSATVYGTNQPPFKEEMSTSSLNPYGSSKMICEKMIADFQKKNSENKFVCLRYFNPVGASERGFLGDYANYKKPKNLFSNIITSTKENPLVVFGRDYDTKDGTCIRDFIHVQDLVKAHILAFEKLNAGFHTLNVGTGVGYSILEVLKEFAENNILVSYEFGDPREGDIPVGYADTERASVMLGWVPEKSLADMVKSEYLFFTKQILNLNH